MTVRKNALCTHVRCHVNTACDEFDIMLSKLYKWYAWHDVTSSHEYNVVASALHSEKIMKSWSLLETLKTFWPWWGSGPIMTPCSSSTWICPSCGMPPTCHVIFKMKWLKWLVKRWYTEPGFAGDIGAIGVWLIDWYSARSPKVHESIWSISMMNLHQTTELIPVCIRFVDKNIWHRRWFLYHELQGGTLQISSRMLGVTWDWTSLTVGANAMMGQRTWVVTESMLKV